ncbi:MAG: 30S ribosome-binding factor RbfA [Anaerolineae bacterium]|nr:30S ribosome-binding factor RbfA [Anaerolineae bacterium]
MPYKQERVSGRIRKILSTLIFREVADPRLAGITVTDVEIDAELMYATVYVNAMGEEEREPEVMIGLEHAKGFLRREVAHRLRLRRAPVLTFKWDASLERGERISHLLSELDIPAEEPAGEETNDPDGDNGDDDRGEETRD